MSQLPTAQEALLPTFKLSINGDDADDKLVADVISIFVSEDLDAVGMCEIALETWDDKWQKLTWLEDGKLNLGSDIEIEMGFKDKLISVFDGQITGLEPEFKKGEDPRLIVRGHDRRHLLLRGKRTQSFVNMSDAKIVKQIAGHHGLTPKVVETKPELQWEYVVQHNQTDFEFLQERARQLGYELLVMGKELHFRPHGNDAKGLITLSAREDLLAFLPRLSTMTQVPQVEVRGWSIQDQEKIVAIANESKEPNKMAGKKLGPKQVAEAFKTAAQASNIVVSDGVTLQAEADLLAAGQLKDMAIAYITAEGTSRGLGDLRVGKMIEIIDAGTMFEGLYYLTAVEHSFSEEDGYETKFTARRNAT